MKYSIWCGKCSSGIKLSLYNTDTDESINIDATYEDTKMVYETLKKFFKNGEKDVKSEEYK